MYAIAGREGIDEDDDIFETAIQKFVNLSWNSFDDFTSCTKRIKILCGSEGSWRCMCYKYSREYLGNDKAIVSKVLENTRLVRTKICHGKTKKAKPALYPQPNAPVLAEG